MPRGAMNTGEHTKTLGDSRHLFAGVRQEDVGLWLLLLRATQVLLHLSGPSGGYQTTQVNVCCKLTTWRVRGSLLVITHS